MPRWLHDQLEAGPKITAVNRIGRDGRLIKYDQVQNETPGIIPILAQLSALDRSVKQAYYCHPSTIHVGKTPHEGGFCGYRNIQMLLSYIQGAKAQGYEEFPGRLPTVLKMQDHIEDAWDKGINEIGRVQTGGIRNTRKYIGTPEVKTATLQPTNYFSPPWSDTLPEQPPAMGLTLTKLFYPPSIFNNQVTLSASSVLSVT